MCGCGCCCAAVRGRGDERLGFEWRHGYAVHGQDRVRLFLACRLSAVAISRFAVSEPLGTCRRRTRRLREHREKGQAEAEATALTSALILPSAGQCVSGRTLTIQLRRLSRVVWVVEKVHVNGRLFETIRRAELTGPVELTSLPRGTFVLFDHRQDGRRAQRDRDSHLSDLRDEVSAGFASVVGWVGGGRVGERDGVWDRLPGLCSHSYAAGTTVTLTAASGSGSSFTGWSGGGCSGTGTCTVTMSSDQSVTATFAANPPPSYTLSVGLAGGGSGSVTGLGSAARGAARIVMRQGRRSR